MSKAPIDLAPDCTEKYKQLSMKSSRDYRDLPKLRYIIFKFSDSFSEISVDIAGEEIPGKSPQEEYEAFLTTFTKPNLPRLAVYDMPYTTQSGMSHSAPIILHFNATNNDLPMMKRIRGQMLTGDGCGKLKDALVPKPKYDHKGDSEAELEYADIIKLFEK